MSLVSREVCSNGEHSEQELELTVSSWSRIACKEITAKFYSVTIIIGTDHKKEISLELAVKGVRIPITCTSSSPFSVFNGEQRYEVRLNNKTLLLKRGDGTIQIHDEVQGDNRSALSKVGLYRRLIRKAKKGSPIWVYYDAPGRLDNAWIQFKHDCRIDDGIQRVYVANGVTATLPSGSCRAKIIQFGTKNHVIVHYAAKKILASDVAFSCWHPRKEKTDSHYRDLFHAELVYLQHGVLWAHMPWYYSKDKVRFDREVISTTFERDNLIRNYGFRQEDLIESGMSRYALIDVYLTPTKNKILVCPSWRNYLIGELQGGERRPMENKFLASEYYRELNSFLHNQSLIDLLEENDWYLDFQLHPNFSCYRHCFAVPDCSRIKIVDSANVGDYKIGITDYSSFSFDFLYLNRALIYFVPDYTLFCAGVNHYNSLDVPLEDAFGEFSATSDSAIQALLKLVRNGGAPLKQYEEKAKDLFLYRDRSQCDRIYNALIHD